jgi:hypothetical protein
MGGEAGKRGGQRGPEGERKRGIKDSGERERTTRRSSLHGIRKARGNVTAGRGRKPNGVTEIAVTAMGGSGSVAA